MKIIGMLFILVGTTGIGLLLSYIEQKRIRDMKDLRQGLMYLRSEINFSLTPFDEAFYIVWKKIDGDIGMFFRNIGQLFGDHSLKNLNKLSENKIVEKLSYTCLKPKDKVKIASFFKSMESTDKASQINHINLHIEEIENMIKKASEDYDKNGKLFKSLGIIAGVFVIVIFI